MSAGSIINEQQSDWEQLPLSNETVGTTLFSKF